MNRRFYSSSSPPPTLIHSNLTELYENSEEWFVNPLTIGHVLATLGGEKHGSTVSIKNNRSSFTHWLETHNLSYQYIERENDSLFYITHGDGSTIPFHGRNQSFSDIEQKDDELARFLGIPDEDIRWWEESGFDLEDTINISENNHCYDDLNELCILSYYPKPTKQGLYRASSIGKSWLQPIKEAEKITGLPFIRLVFSERHIPTCFEW